MKATAIAYPIQGLIKYHGLRDEGLKLPYHDSISVCTSPTATTTTVEFGSDHKTDSIKVNGRSSRAASWTGSSWSSTRSAGSRART